MDTKPNTGKCPQCGVSITAQAPSGLCPRCLMGEAMQATVTSPGKITATPPSLEDVAAAFPDYDVLSMIGRGGMGAVFRARQKSLDRDVALKVLPPELAASDPKFAERFEAEAKALATMAHPNIVTVHDFGKAGEFYFLSMELVDGVNLRELLGAGQLSPEEAIGIVPPLCDALQYAHERGVIHCDIKPENLLLAKDGRVKVADFGIARIIGGDGHTGGDDAVSGTPAYMAPEQLHGEGGKIDRRADIYSLGIVLYEMLTGERPDHRLQPPSEKVAVDIRIDEIVLRALKEKPELRFQTAAELRTQLETISQSKPTPPQQPAPALAPEQGSSAESPRSKKAAIWALCLTLVSLVVSLTLIVLSLTLVSVTETEEDPVELYAAHEALNNAIRNEVSEEELAPLVSAVQEAQTRQMTESARRNQQGMARNQPDIWGMLIPLVGFGLSIGAAIAGCTMGWGYLGRERHLAPPHRGVVPAGFSALCWPILLGALVVFSLVSVLMNEKRTENIELVLGIIAALGIAFWSIRCTILWFSRRPTGATLLYSAGFFGVILVVAAVLPALYH